MSSTLAHELNQPLCAISSYAQACAHLLQSNNTQQETLIDTLDKIVSQAERASSIVRRLRDLVRKKAPARVLVGVAQKLLLSPRTVESHRSHIMKKLHVSSIPELVQLIVKIANHR